MSNIIPFEGGKVPSFLKNKAPAASELMANVGGPGYPVMSIKGKVFTLVKNGERETLMNPADPDEVATSISVVILKANPNLSKVFYLKQFVEGSDAKPDCFSNDGVAPDPSVESPMAKKCATCPKNEWGSRVGDDGRKGKACGDSRRLAIAKPDEIDAPILLRAPAATLKPLAEFGAELAKRGVPYSAVVTKIGFDRDAASPKLTFKPVGFLSEEQYAEVQKVVAEDVVASILGKPGEAPVAENEEPATEEAPKGAPGKPRAEAKPAAEKPKAEAKKAKPVVSEDEVADALGEDAEKPAPAKAEAKPAPAAKKAEPKVSEGDNLEEELDGLLSSLDD